MFGLDARIALAIFGGLSIITGAALFSAINKTHATTMMVDLQDINKATTQYMLDTGTNLPLHDANFYNINNLWLPSTIPGYNGPYLVREDAAYGGAGDYVLNAGPNTLFVYRGNDDPSASFPDACTTTNCYAWAGLYTHANTSFFARAKTIAEELDKQIDDGDGGSTGSLRFREIVGSPTEFYIFLKGPVALR